MIDCFHKVRNLYDYVAVIDFDELIMPMMEENMTWEDIIKGADAKEHIDAYVSQNVYYPETNKKPSKSIPKYMYMLQHNQRSQKRSKIGAAVKSLLSTERVLSVFSHKPYQCLSETEYNCAIKNLSTNISQNSHYRIRVEKQFQATIEDNTIWKYKERLTKDVQGTLAATGFSP